MSVYCSGQALVNECFSCSTVPSAQHFGDFSDQRSPLKVVRINIVMSQAPHSNEMLSNLLVRSTSVDTCLDFAIGFMTHRVRVRVCLELEAVHCFAILKLPLLRYGISFCLHHLPLIIRWLWWQ